MTPIAEMVKRMLEKGVAHDAIVMAIEGAELALCPQISAESADERRRRKDRERKAAVRGNLRKSAEICGMSESASLSREEKKEEIKKERGERKGNVRGHRLADDWAPNAQDLVVADELIGADRRRDELAKFRDHWKQQPGSKGVKLDWDAAWRNWIRRAAEYGGNRNGHRTHNAPRRSASADFLAGIAGVAADIAGDGPASGDAGAEVPLGRVNIDG